MYILHVYMFVLYITYTHIYEIFNAYKYISFSDIYQRESGFWHEPGTQLLGRELPFLSGAARAL